MAELARLTVSFPEGSGAGFSRAHGIPVSIESDEAGVSGKCRSGPGDTPHPPITTSPMFTDWKRGEEGRSAPDA